MESFSKREKYCVFNTLSCVPHVLLGEAVLIDLRNDTSVAGRITNADGSMNIDLVEAVFIDQCGQQYPFEEFMVRERMIRQIHIPKHIRIDEAVREFIERRTLRKRQKPTKGKPTFKVKRSQVRHKEILDEIHKQHKEQDAKQQD